MAVALGVAARVEVTVALAEGLDAVTVTRIVTV